jgi:hypothetical protein
VKAWTVLEIENIVSSLEPLAGLRLQEVMTSAQDVVLGFYSSEGLLWLWVDLNALNPGLLPWVSLPFKPEVQKTPLQLFLRAHFVGRTLRAVKRETGSGRVVRLCFGVPEDNLELELRLFPHGRNLLARAGDKHLSWHKVQDLPPPVETAGGSGTRLRSLEDLRREWLAQRGRRAARPSTATKADPRARLERELTKKQSALAKVDEELERKKNMPWREIGDWLKAHQSLDVPKEWEPFVDRRRKLAWNIERCFTKAREAEGKVEGTANRRRILQDEIENLERRLAEPVIAAPAEAFVRPQAPSLAKMEAKGRTLHLRDDLTAVMGKSAADNMKILRKARAWDLLLHLRDFPSSHVILFRNKNTPVSDNVLWEVSQWFVRQHLGFYG